MLTAHGLVQKRFLLLMRPFFPVGIAAPGPPLKKEEALIHPRAEQGTPKLCLRVPPPQSVKSMLWACYRMRESIQSPFQNWMHRNPFTRGQGHAS